MRKIAVFGLLLASVLPATAADTGAARVKVVAPFLDEQTFGVIHVDLGRVEVSAVMDRVQKITRLPQVVLAQPRKDLTGLVGGLKQAGARDVYVVLSLADLPLQPPLVIVPLGNNADAAALQKLLKHEAATVFHGAVVTGSEQALKRVKQQKSVSIPELEAGFAAMADTAAQAVFVVSSDTRRVLREMQPTLPKILGGGSSAVLTQGIRWAAIGVNWPPQTAGRLVIHSLNAQAAQALNHWLTTRLQELGRLPQVEERFPNVRKLAAALHPTVKGAELELTLNERALALLAPAAGKVVEAQARTQETNNLKQIVLALYNYADMHKGRFPAYAIMSKDGKPLLSWRVAILPFLGQQKLYEQFHLDERWDSPHNRKLITKIPIFYQSSEQLKAQGKTTILGVRGKHMMFPDDHGVAIREVTDGTSNTIFVVDANDQRAVPWTKPADFRPDPKNPSKGLTGRFAHIILAAFADDHIQFLSDKIKPGILNALFTRNGGEVLSSDQY